MTTENLLSYGYTFVQNIAHSDIDTILKKDNFLVIVNEDGTFTFRCFIGDIPGRDFRTVVNSLHELGLAEKEYYEAHSEYYREKAETFETMARNYVVPTCD